MRLFVTSAVAVALASGGSPAHAAWHQVDPPQPASGAYEYRVEPWGVLAISNMNAPSQMRTMNGGRTWIPVPWSPPGGVNPDPEYAPNVAVANLGTSGSTAYAGDNNGHLYTIKIVSALLTAHSQLSELSLRGRP
jgi:hypothetical protein